MARCKTSILRGVHRTLHEGRHPDAVAAMFSGDTLFEIPSDDGVLPRVGIKACAVRAPRQ